MFVGKVMVVVRWLRLWIRFGHSCTSELLCVVIPEENLKDVTQSKGKMGYLKQPAVNGTLMAK